MRAWLDAQIEFLKQSEFRSGCLIGNFTMETSGQNASFRQRLVRIFQEIEQSLVYCLKAAVKAGELPKSTNVREIAGFLYSSWQGAILQSKADQSIKPLERFKKVLFGTLLR